MPGHYFADSVITVTKKGKLSTDTAWHQLPEISLTNQLGQKVSWKDIHGKIIVADFFFTHCPSICPKMTLSLKEVNEYFIEHELSDGLPVVPPTVATPDRLPAAIGARQPASASRQPLRLIMRTSWA